MIGWISFFTIVLLSIIFIVIFIKLRKATFIDINVAIMAALMSFAFDMLFCKQIHTYHYVAKEYSGINSLIAGLTIFPAISMAYTVYLPKKTSKLFSYVLIWSSALTIFELLVVPLKIVKYGKWHIIPWSPILYIIVFYALYYYKKTIKKYCKEEIY